MRRLPSLVVGASRLFTFLSELCWTNLLTYPVWEIFRCRRDDYIGWSAWRMKPLKASWDYFNSPGETCSLSRATLKKKYDFLQVELPPLCKNISFLFKIAQKQAFPPLQQTLMS